MSVLQNKRASFIVEFPLKTTTFQKHILDRRLNIGRTIYNSLVTVTQKRYREMVKTKEYRRLINAMGNDKKVNAPIYKALAALRKQYRLTEYDFHSDVKEMQHHFSENIDSCTAQKIATALWKAYEKLFFGIGKSIHYKKYGSMVSVEGKTNTSGIRFKNNMLYWNGLVLPVVINRNNPYEAEAVSHPVSYCRIVRKVIKGKTRYSVQLILNGMPPIKTKADTGEAIRCLGSGDVGIDIGTSTVAVSSNKTVFIQELADAVVNLEREKQRLQRRMDRSRRSTNPNNYNADGTIKKQGNKKVRWVRSNHYLKSMLAYKELCRKQAAVRKYQHECLANRILALGDVFYVEKMHFSGLQKRAKNTEKNSNECYKRKKRFGKSIANRAPAMLLSILDRKLHYYGTALIKINTAAAKASQFNHADQSYQKKALSKRWAVIDGEKVQRDMYSAFLIQNVNSDLSSFNVQKCNKQYSKFKALHDLEVERLIAKKQTGQKNLSCVGI